MQSAGRGAVPAVGERGLKAGQRVAGAGVLLAVPAQTMRSGSIGLLLHTAHTLVASGLPARAIHDPLPYRIQNQRDTVVGPARYPPTSPERAVPGTVRMTVAPDELLVVFTPTWNEPEEAVELQERVK